MLAVERLHDVGVAAHDVADGAAVCLVLFVAAFFSPRGQFEDQGNPGLLDLICHNSLDCYYLPRLPIILQSRNSLAGLVCFFGFSC